MRTPRPTPAFRGPAVWAPRPPRIVAAALVGVPGGAGAAVLPAPARSRAWSTRRRRNFRRHTAVPLVVIVAGTGALAYDYIDRSRTLAPPRVLAPAAPARPLPAPPPTVALVPDVELVRPRALPAEIAQPPTSRAARRKAPAARPKAVVKAKPAYPEVHWRTSQSVGLPYGGRLDDGVQLPAFGRDFVTANPLGKGFNPGFRRWGTDRLVRAILKVSAQFHRLHPKARLVIGDMSLQHGGPFVGFGGLGHKSHQSGIDVDIPYPRRDHREQEPGSVGEIDHQAAQDLVNLWVRFGVQFIFVGPNTGLTGPSGIVQTLVYHDDHMHVRLLPR